MATTSFVTLRQRWQTKFYAGQFPFSGTATGGTTGTLVDSGAGLSGASSDFFDHYWIKIVSTTDNLAPQGEIRQVTEAGYTAASGTFAVSANFTVAPGAGDTYEIHRDFHPSEADTMLNERARNLFVPAYFPLSAQLMVNDDNDMESTATITGMWSNSNGTLTKATSPLMDGTQVLKNVATATGGYAYPLSNFPCNPNLTYMTAVSCAVTDGDSARLTLIDVTNSNATIDQSAAVTLTDWQDLIIQWTPPSGCRSMQARLTSVANTDVSFWDNYQTWIQGEYAYVLPTWISQKEQVIDVVGFPYGTGGSDSDYASNQTQGIPLNWSFQREDYAATNEIRIYVECNGNVRPYIIARRPITAVSYDYGTAGVGAGALGSPANTVPLNDAQADALVMGTYAESCRRIAGRHDGGDRDYYIREASRAETLYKAAIERLGLSVPIRRYHSNRTTAVMR